MGWHRYEQWLMRRPRHRWMALAAVLVVAAVARGLALGSESFWFDEIWSVTQVRLGLGELLADLRASDVHPPLYSALLWAWTRLVGEGEFAVRSLSALIGVSAVGFGAGLAGQTYVRAPLVVAVGSVLALHPYLVDYSQEARSYSLLTAATFASTWALLRWFQTPHRPVRALLYTVAALILAYTHVYGLFALLGHASWALALAPRALRPSWPALAGVAAAVAVGFAPWVAVLAEQAGRVQSGFWIAPLSWQDAGIAVHAWGGYNPVVGVVLLIGAAVTVARAPAHPLDATPGSVSLAALTAVTPIAVGIAASLAGQPIFVHKYAIGSVGLLIVLAAGSLLAMRPSRAVAALSAVLALLLAGVIWMHLRTDKEQWRELIAFGRQQHALGATIVADEHNRPYLPFYDPYLPIVWLPETVDAALDLPPEAAVCHLMVHPASSPWEHRLAQRGRPAAAFEGRLARAVCTAPDGRRR